MRTHVHIHKYIYKKQFKSLTSCTGCFALLRFLPAVITNKRRQFTGLWVSFPPSQKLSCNSSLTLSGLRNSRDWLTVCRIHTGLCRLVRRNAEIQVDHDKQMTCRDWSRRFAWQIQTFDVRQATVMQRGALGTSDFSVPHDVTVCLYLLWCSSGWGFTLKALTQTN